MSFQIGNSRIKKKSNVVENKSTLRASLTVELTAYYHCQVNLYNRLALNLMHVFRACVDLALT